MKRRNPELPEVAIRRRPDKFENLPLIKVENTKGVEKKIYSDEKSSKVELNRKGEGKLTATGVKKESK